MCKDEKKMSAPSMKPMEVRFKNKADREKFLNWAESTQKTNSPEMNKLRQKIKEARKMRKSGKYKF